MNYLVKSDNCITGINNQLLIPLRTAIREYGKIDIIVAFLMESGVKMLLDDFQEAIDRGAEIRILCGNYLNITQPHALYLLKLELGDRIDLRFYSDAKRSFHPKAYIFENHDNGVMFVGSSNLSRSALTSGLEWNYRIEKSSHEADFDFFKKEFQDLFLNRSIIIDDEVLRAYSTQWKKPKIDFFAEDSLEGKSYGIQTEDDLDAQNKVAETLQRIVQTQYSDSQISAPRSLFCPKGAQIEALYSLKKAREEGWEKGLIVAATGIGKTYLAAFDSREFSRILFIAHREEILVQAERSFRNVRPELKTGFYFGEQKNTDADIIFATVQTLGKEAALCESVFRKSDFEYIIIDEFHHAVAGNYEKILSYFEPRFLLGLTATPERMDNEDVFALCDYNVVYEVRLKEAINKGWLVPFRYYGIYDPTNYEKITYKNGQYNVEELEAALTHKDRARLVLNNYSKYSSNCCLAFCMNVRHATEMAQFFTENGVSARAVVSSISSLQQNAKSFVIERQEGISQLISGRINVIFSVDMFNEGLDVPNIDLILFLRPTESPTVFLQQLGRGLRTHRGKLYVNVLDFIGNYKKANLIPFILIDSKSAHNRKSGEKTKGLPEGKDFPEGCLIDFDFKILDLFKKMDAAQKVYFEDIVAEEYRISENIGRRALRLELYTYMREELVRNALTKNDLNIFKDFLGHLDKIGKLDEEERILVGTVAHEFLKELEKTAMSRLYKMPVLLGFYNNGEFKMEVDNYDIAENFKAFYANHANAIDLENQNSTKDFMNWDLNKYITLAKKNPMKFLMESAPQFFSMKDDRFCLSEDLEPYIKNSAFVRHFKDIIDYRTRRFYKERLEKKVAK